MLDGVPVRSALMPALRARALALQAESLRALGRMNEAESVLQRAGASGEERVAHLVATSRWKDAVAVGEKLTGPERDLPDSLRQSWVRKQLQIAYGKLGDAPRATSHLEWRRKVWTGWAERRPANPQVRAELRGAS